MTAILSGLHLLLVEDEAMVALMVEDMLIDLGCTRVEVAGTVSQGLAKLAEPDAPLDGAILDVNLGGEKVYPIAEVLAARRIPFIFATGYGIEGIAADFSHVPALAKPYESRALENMLTRALNLSAGGA
jgi:CheY-like chemotaxis protein